MKPTIRYCFAYTQPLVGHGAFIRLVDDHPRCATKEVHTSAVVRIDPNGDFETLNTEYKYAPEQAG
jgi:hypothetical protein